MLLLECIIDYEHRSTKDGHNIFIIMGELMLMLTAQKYYPSSGGWRDPVGQHRPGRL